MAVSLAGESSARVISTRWAAPPWNCSSRTSEPTETASSTSAVSSWGVETETSTPQLSLKSHWFFGWLTRATTRGTANSCLASSEITRLSSSSPVAATTTSTVASPAASSDDDLAGVGGDPGDVEGRAQPLDELGVLLEDQHLVAVGVQVRGDGGADAAGAGDGDLHDAASSRAALGRGRRRRARCQRVVEHGEVQDVALLADELAGVEPGHAGAGDGDELSAARAPRGRASGRPGPGLGQRALDERERARWRRTTRRRRRRAAGAAAPGRWST